MLRLANLHPLDHRQNYSVIVDRLVVNGQSWDQYQLDFRYRADWSVIVDLTKIYEEQARGRRFLDWEDAEVLLKHGDKEAMLLVTNYPLFFIEDGAPALAIPTSEPLIMGRTEGCRKYDFRLLNPPRLKERDIDLVGLRNQRYSLRFPDSSADYLNVEARVDSAPDFLKAVGDLIDFMTFVRGVHCGVGHGNGVNEAGEIQATVVGFSRHDAGVPCRNWFDFRLQSSLPEIFLKFSHALEVDGRQDAIRRIIGLYRTSNAARPIAIELAIISAHSALECAVHYILESMAGLSKTKASRRKVNFSEKLKQAVTLLDVNADPGAAASNLSKMAEKHGHEDVLVSLPFIRNKIVHQDPRYEPEGTELHEAWLLMQWLVEIFFFKIIGYSGEIMDRRVYQGLPKRCTV